MLVKQRNRLPKVYEAMVHILPQQRGQYCGVKWRASIGGYLEAWNFATGGSIGICAGHKSWSITAREALRVEQGQHP